ncbi:Nitrilotriacetate monooxygenase component A/pristinamycin IIA synthase subunit A [Thermobacillus xylanilyticus]|uniref:Nitrilotriacetate monooxygenase component A/pristinamycin IIA synthase subunit A n=1 Tax=Thermobacillus xylanilyticus TaxID=76633 RepID=A0ABN7RU05_THEXY|nr:Nitrilotriacetate monooxygenase component A/pristinamycin IIA synthase subunit A [Thermobacillus xylanilyticus]
MSKRQLSLGAFFMLPGQHAGAWRDPSTKRENLWNPGYLAELARTAEKGKFDLIFVADGVSAGYTSRAFEYGARVTQFEPLTMFSYLAAVTEKIGFVATASTTYNEPFNLARQFASLDHLSKGRAGWNVVTSTGEEAARNFGKRDQDWPHHLRYERAHEFLDIVKKLWDSWEDDAILYDQEKGVFLDKRKVHRVNYEGRHLRSAVRSTSGARRKAIPSSCRPALPKPAENWRPEPPKSSLRHGRRWRKRRHSIAM